MSIGSGHDAGYMWAREHDVTQEDVDAYSGPSQSFREGMQEFVDEQAQAQQDQPTQDTSMQDQSTDVNSGV